MNAPSLWAVGGGETGDIDIRSNSALGAVDAASTVAVRPQVSGQLCASTRRKRRIVRGRHTFTRSRSAPLPGGAR